MKIVYINKKGFHCYPPCLSQVLYLNDLGIDLEVYHGVESEAINEIFETRGIVHRTLRSDRKNRNRLQSMKTMIAYHFEIERIVATYPKDTLFWFGTCEAAMGAYHSLKTCKFVLSVLELYNQGSAYDKFLKKYLAKAQAVLCCEKHRAEIMKVYYNLKKTPYILPNKPYELKEKLHTELPAQIKARVRFLQDKFVVLYQGIITPDRPLEKIAEALRKIGDDNNYFVVLGDASEKMKERLTAIYDKIIFMGYIPSPQHLSVTSIADIGIANYDYSCLNNLFCAPNKIYEYAKFGLPMLTSQNIGLTETVGHYQCAECIDFTDADCIAEGICKIKRHKADYVENAIRFYNDCDNANVMNEIVNTL